MARVFVSHSSKDKGFVRKLSADLENSGHKVWFDEWNIKVGEPIPTKIEEGLGDCDFVIAVLSPNAMKSNWFDREWKAKYWDEVNRNQITVLPVLLEDCELPHLLKTKKYADFTVEYDSGFQSLLAALGVEVSSSVNRHAKSENYFSDVVSVLSKTQDRNNQLSVVIAEVLTLANKIGNTELREFCKQELLGWRPDKSSLENKDDQIAYRLMPYYFSFTQEINPSAWMWQQNPDNVFKYMDDHKDNFFKAHLFIHESISQLESKRVPDGKGFLTIPLKVKDVLPKEKKHADAPISAYARDNGYMVMIEGIRSELVRRLVTLIG